tara:strand:- start:679 stop:840 length:162 start_codon:yes stop_codon:yes gene_type:complete
MGFIIKIKFSAQLVRILLFQELLSKRSTYKAGDNMLQQKAQQALKSARRFLNY